MSVDSTVDIAADRAVKFINALTHAKGSQWARRKFNLRPWQETFIRELFGSLREDGSRRYRKALFAVARKNGKTELGAAIALYMLCSEPEEGGEIYSAATDREQASLVFNVAAQMVKNDATLSRLCQITESRRQIKYAPTNSVYRAIPADAPHAHGYNASALIYDELHAAPNAELWDVLTTSMGARQQPITLAITTAGYNHESICFKVWEYARGVRDGLIDDPSFLPCIFEAPADADWRDEATWRLANPALADFRSIDEMRELFREAQHMPARENVFRQLYLNQWVESSARWISSEAWASGEGEIDRDSLLGQPCYAGLDLSTTTDLSALTLIFPQPGGNFVVLPYAWCPKENARQRQNRDRAPYETWIREGIVRATEGNSIDYDRIRADINELGQLFDIKKIAADRWNATQIIGQLRNDGFDIVAHGQGFRDMSPPTKELERLILAGKLHHGGNPLLTWAMANVQTATDPAGNLKPDKGKSTDRIDPVVALVMAIALATQDDGGDYLKEILWINT